MIRVRIAIVVATALSLPAVAVAQPSCDLPVSAYLTDAAGDPLAGSVDVELSFYIEDDAVALPLECRSFTSVAVDEGWMRLTVDACATPDGSGCGVGSLRALLSASRESGLWVGVTLGDSADELEPRIPLGAVPFALNAENAARLGGLEMDEFERVGVAGDGLAVHAADPDAHHPANSSGIAIEPTSVTVGGARVTDGEVDLGPDADDSLTAEIVRTLTGGGAADALHTHTGGSADLAACYTVWGDAPCGDGFTSMYSGTAAESLHWDNNSYAATSGGTICIDSDTIATFVGGLSYVDASEIASVNSSPERITLTSGRLACQICCR
jgi:hypothetical protein